MVGLRLTDRERPSSAELSHSSKVSDRRLNILKSVLNRSESLRAGLWVPCRIFWAWFGPALGSNPVRNRRCPAGSYQIFGALSAQSCLCIPCLIFGAWIWPSFRPKSGSTPASFWGAAAVPQAPGLGGGIGDLWMWLQFMWLQFEIVRGPVGVAWGRFAAGLEPVPYVTQ